MAFHAQNDCIGGFYFSILYRPHILKEVFIGSIGKGAWQHNAMSDGLATVRGWIRTVWLDLSSKRLLDRRSEQAWNWRNTIDLD
jgi:hypothetical protein